MSDRSRRTSPRRGFALLAVLWVITSASVIALGMALKSRDAVATAANRISQIRASWRADGCVARARFELARIEAEPPHRAAEIWLRLDSAVGTPAWAPDCGMALHPAGMAIDVNAADEPQLERLFRGLGALPVVADSLADAILDWRDTDDVPRHAGAERLWYVEHRMRSPRDGPVAATGELRDVRGMAPLFDPDSVLSVEPARLFVSRAPLAALGSLPGVNPETLARIAAHRAMGHDVPDWVQVSTEVSPQERVQLMQNLLELGRRTTSTPDAWLLDLAVHAGHPAIASTRRLRLVRLGASSIAVSVQTRWP